MSLQLLAKQMEAKGRKGDSMLVHMTAKEVAALQKMAESAGGSLSVNPETGLVEANFLKRMLPTLVGIGVGAATMNPYLGAAAGAAVGGYQAKRNDQDVLLGAAMGGLGGYGGASLAGGLTSAGAGAAQQTAMSAIPQGATTAAHTAAQNAAMQGLSGPAANQAAAEASKTLMAQGFGSDAAIQNLAAAQASKQFVAQPALTQMGQGISALGKETGRDLFMQGVGGAGGLAKTASMAATPLMAAGKRPGDPEVDDEMYSYTFDPGRTGAEETPTDSTAERRYFDGRFSPVRKIRASEYPVYAAQGGLMSLAEGGETAAPAEAAAPTASEAALAYLMGERSSSAAGLPAASPPPTSAQPMPAPPAMAPDQMFSFSPTTGTFTRNPDYVDPTAKPVIDPNLFTGGGGGGGGGGDGYTGYTGDFYGHPNDYRGMTQSELAEGGGGVGAAQGGLLGLAKGGMASGGFVVPADVVSALGNGSTDAGLRKLSAMMGDVKPIKGKGDGLSDSIPTNIDGKQPARVADGEAYIDPKTVKRLGGAKKLYAMMDKVRAQAHGKTTQQRKVNPGRVMA